MQIQELLWRVDDLRHDLSQAVKLEQIRVALGTLATESLAFRKIITFTQPAWQAVVLPYRDAQNPTLKVERIFAIIDTTDNPKGRELAECHGEGIRSLHAPELIDTGTPHRYVPIGEFAILDKRPIEARTLKALVAVSPLQEVDEIPMTGRIVEAIVSGASWLILRHPGKGQDKNLAVQFQREFFAACANLRGAAAMSMGGLPVGYLLQMPCVMDPETIPAPEGVGDPGGGDPGGGDPGGGTASPVIEGILLGAPLGDGGQVSSTSSLHVDGPRSTGDATQRFMLYGSYAIGWFFDVLEAGTYRFFCEQYAVVRLFDLQSNEIYGSSDLNDRYWFDLSPGTYVVTVNPANTLSKSLNGAWLTPEGGGGNPPV